MKLLASRYQLRLAQEVLRSLDWTFGLSKGASSHCSASPRQMSRSLQRLIDHIAVIDEPRDKPDRPYLAYQRGAEADLIDPNDA
jgi:hypothetical protein